MVRVQEGEQAKRSTYRNVGAFFVPFIQSLVLNYILVKYYIYILYSFSADRYYVGYSPDPFIRLEQHLTNHTHKFTGKWKDWKLKAIFYVSENRETAITVEKFIKKQKSRKLVEKLIDVNFIPNGELAQLVRVPHVRN